VARRKKRSSAITYARRLTEDDYVHGQLRQAAGGLRQAYGRAARRRGKAAEDKKLYGHLRDSATAIRRAMLALQRKPPEPKHRGRKLGLVMLAGGGAAVAMSETGRTRVRSLMSRAAEPAVNDVYPDQ
jgi:hypothetical protein